MTKVIIDVTETCYDEVRKKLIAMGDGGTILESGVDRRIDMTGVTLRTRKAQRAVPPNDDKYKGPF